MSERFEKTYISIHEFIDAWEKELYELTLLDYFTYMLINDLGYQIEHNFINTKKQTPYLQIDADEIGTLAFNIADSLETFLEHNCLGACSLNCAINIHKKITPEEIEFANKNLHIIQIVHGQNLTRKQFLMTDILNYVVVDTLYDFYHYEIGLEIDDKDLGLLQFADFITLIIEKFIESQGNKYLSNHQETAADLFNKLIEDSENSWEDPDGNLSDDEYDESESWKHNGQRISEIIEEYRQDQQNAGNQSQNFKTVLEFINKYSEEYAGILTIDEFSHEDIKEFCSYWLPRELIVHDVSIEEAGEVYSGFFEWLQISREINLSKDFNTWFNTHKAEIKNAVDIARTYLNKHSVVESMLFLNSPESGALDGLFEIISVSSNGLYRVRDFYREEVYFNLQMDLEPSQKIQTGSLLEGSIRPTSWGWRVVHLEYLYPASARQYLNI